MGKLHRIKRRFARVVAQNPMPEGDHRLGFGAYVYVGNRRFYSPQYLLYYGTPYKKFIQRLIRDYTESR